MDTMITSYDANGRLLDTHRANRDNLDFSILAQIMRKQNPAAVRLVVDVALDNS